MKTGYTILLIKWCTLKQSMKIPNGQSNLFKAYHKHKENDKAVTYWKNLHICTKCEFNTEYMDANRCDKSKRSIQMQITDKCPINKY